MGYIDGWDDMDLYEKFLLEQAEDAMHDREVGLLGQCRACEDARRLREGTYFSHKQDPPVVCMASMKPEPTPEPVVQKEEQSMQTPFGIPVISW